MEFRFYYPKKWLIDPSLFLLLLISVSCILIGSLWAASDAKEQLLNSKLNPQLESKINNEINILQPVNLNENNAVDIYIQNKSYSNSEKSSMFIKIF